MILNVYEYGTKYRRSTVHYMSQQLFNRRIFMIVLTHNSLKSVLEKSVIFYKIPSSFKTYMKLKF